MSETLNGCIDQTVENDFDAFSDVLDETDGRSLYDFFDAGISANPEIITVCQRLSKYLEATDGDVVFGVEAGIHFAVTMTGLAAYQTSSTLDILSDMLIYYESHDYTDSQRCIIESVDSFFENNPTLDSFTHAYLLTDIQENYDDLNSGLYMDSTKLASRLSAGLAFMALEEKASTQNIDTAAARLLSV